VVPSEVLDGAMVRGVCDRCENEPTGVALFVASSFFYNKK